MLVAPPPDAPPLDDPPPDELRLEPELPPPLGMLELEPPELPEDPEEPEEPDEPPDDGLGIEGEGMLEDEEEESAQPPIRNAAVALIEVTCAAMTNSRRIERRVDIAWSPVALVTRTHILDSLTELSIASSHA
jgi:hypothetical protein